MKVALSEKQVKLITSMVEADSDTSASATTDSTTASSSTTTSKDTTSYPQVDKWESGITRGPANPLGVAKWEDVVGVKLTRGHANPLNEQGDVVTGAIANYAINDALKNDTPYIEVPAFFGENIRIPKDSSDTIKYFKADDNLVVRFADKQRGPNGEILWSGEPAPSEADLKQVLPVGTLRSFKTKKDGNFYSIILQKNENTNTWEPNKNYYATVNNQNIPYNPKNYINYSTSTNILEFLNEHGEIIAQITLSIAAAMATGGMSIIAQCVAQAAVQVPFAIEDISKGNKIGAIMSLAICFLPFGGKLLKIGTKYNATILKQLEEPLNKCTTIEEVQNVIKNAKLDQPTEVVLSRLVKQTPEEFGKLIASGLIEGFKNGVKNGTIILEKIPSGQLMWWKKLLIEGGAGMVAMVGASYADVVLSAPQRKELINSISVATGKIGKNADVRYNTSSKNANDSAYNADLEWNKAHAQKKITPKANKDPLGIL
jgi:hypothetical protein